MSRSRYKVLFYFGICLTFLPSLAPDALAQYPYQFDTWTTENGLPQNSINDILQTRDGYLWISTNGGLVRFDGVRFVVFDRSNKGIKSQRVRALLEDSKGVLWIGTEDGMLIQYRDGNFSTFTVDDGLPFAQTSKIEEDDTGNLWITWHGAATAITKFDGERFVTYRPGDFSHGVNGGPEHRYPWWSQDFAGLHYLVKGVVWTHSFQGNLSKAHVARVEADFRGNLWIQTRGTGILKLTNRHLKRFTRRDGLLTNSLEGAFFEDHKGNLWFADKRKQSLYRIRDGKHELVSQFAVSKLYEDREGSLWIGTLMGLHRARELAITLLTEREGLSHNWAYPILQDREGAIWIGSRGVDKFERGRFTHYGTSEGLPSLAIRCIYQDNSGKLWVGTDAGLCYLKNGRFESYDDEHGFLRPDVWSIHHDRAGNLWFGTDQGLVRSKNGIFTSYASKDSLLYGRIDVLFEDRVGTLWIGTRHGLMQLKDGAFTAYTERDGFIGNQVRTIHEDSDRVLWIGTYDGGLYRLKDRLLTRYTTKEGLYDNGVFQILEDNAGNLWMGCNRGIYRVSRRELNDFAERKTRSITSVVFGVGDGLSTLECNGGPQPSGLKTADGRLWFPTMGGVAIVDPSAVRSNKVMPHVIIEEFRVGDESKDFLRGVEIPHNENNFEIRYTAPSFTKPERVKFRYKLEGLEEDWVHAGGQRTVRYHRIPPGRYRFLVTAANNEGDWNPEGKSLEIVVIPPFWRMWWFIALATLVAVFMIFLIYERWRRRRRKEQAMREAFAQKLIESQDAERQRISLEMHDSLGQDVHIIKARARVSKERLTGNEAVKQELDEIVFMAEKIYGDMKEIAYGLAPYQLGTIGLSKTIESMIKKANSAYGIDFVTDIAKIDELVEEHSRINIYRIIQESVSNIIKHSKAQSAKVTIRRENNLVEIRIQDNGEGFSIEAVDSANPPRTSFGLMGIRERAKMMGGEAEIRTGNGSGTTIVVTFRLKEGRGAK